MPDYPVFCYTLCFHYLERMSHCVNAIVINRACNFKILSLLVSVKWQHCIFSKSRHLELSRQSEFSNFELNVIFLLYSGIYEWIIYFYSNILGMPNFGEIPKIIRLGSAIVKGLLIMHVFAFSWKARKNHVYKQKKLHRQNCEKRFTKIKIRKSRKN